MFDELKKYKKHNHFFFNPGDDLEAVCNAPDLPGVFYIYRLANHKVQLVYIGHSSHQVKETPSKRFQVEFYTLREEIINGCLFGRTANKESWSKKLKDENIDALDVYWHATMDKQTKDFPEDVERLIMQQYIHLHGRLPLWNEKKRIK